MIMILLWRYRFFKIKKKNQQNRNGFSFLSNVSRKFKIIGHFSNDYIRFKTVLLFSINFIYSIKAITVVNVFIYLYCEENYVNDGMKIKINFGSLFQNHAKA